MAVLVITGVSGAGKDTMASRIAQIMDTKNIKFSQPMKEMMSYAYGVDISQFEDKQKRFEYVPGENFTYSDIMIRCFHTFPNIDSKMMIRKTKEVINNHINQTNLVFTDIRNIPEVRVIWEISKEYPVIHIHINTEKEGLTSDKNLHNVLEMLGIMDIPRYTFFNKYEGIEAIDSFLDDVLEDYSEVIGDMYYRHFMEDNTTSGL